MRYTAAALTAAARPVVLTIGRVSDRRGLRRLSRWFVARCRTWAAQPISTPQMLSLQAARHDPVAYLVTLAPILRAVLPRRWWYRFTGDPVAMVLALPADLMGKVLGALMTIPGTDVDATIDEDPIEMIRRAQREAVYGPRGARGPVPSLALAALTVRAAYGDGWYWNPARWATSDGYAPFAVTWLEFVGVQALEARRRLEVADGYALANAKDPKRARRAFELAAYPSEVH